MDPVLCTSTVRLRKDELTYDSEGGNENEIYKDCDITTPPGTFSLCLPVTKQISLEKYEIGKGQKRKISLGYIRKNLESTR